MEFEFDKEMDILLRQSARQVETVSDIAAAHLDADEINAFAERALPEKARIRATEHLADCVRCRKILSNLPVLNAGSESKIVPAGKTEMISVPWYERLFAFPQIVYAMGVLALIFSGIIGIVVLKNSPQNGSLQIAQTDEKSFTEKSVSTAAEDTNTALSNSAVSAVNSASSANSNTSAAAANHPNKNITTAKPNPAEAQHETDKSLKPASNAAAPTDEEKETAKKEKTTADTDKSAPARKENNYQVDGAADSVTAKPQPEVSQNSVVQNQTLPAPDSPRSVQSLPINGRSTQRMSIANQAKMKAEVVAGEAKDDKGAAETRSVGGKKFRRADGVWYDLNYKGQKTINISRSSEDYQKLDGDLRSIADKFGGVVVIVWKDKAYRIQ